MRDDLALDYGSGMSFVPSNSLAAAFAPLRETFGSALTMKREGGRVRWRLEGLETLVEARGDRSVLVTFVEGVGRDVVADEAVRPLFRTRAEYRLTDDGARHLASDMLAFFRGVREPRFQFSGFAETALVRS